MKIKGIIATRQVFIGEEELLPYESQKVRNHSPDGFCWGYGGSGPAQLALALMLRFTKDESKTLAWYQDFKWKVIATLPRADFEMDESVVTDWIKKHIAFDSKTEYIL